MIDYVTVMQVSGIKIGSACQRAIESQLLHPTTPSLEFYKPRIFFKVDRREPYIIKIGQAEYRVEQPYFASHLTLAPSTENTFSPDLSSEAGMYPWLSRLNMLWVFGRLWDLGALTARDELTLNIVTGWLAISELQLAAAPWFPLVLLMSAWQQPGFWHTAAAAVDRVNAYNDLARRTGNPCSYEGTGE